MLSALILALLLQPPGPVVLLGIDGLSAEGVRRAPTPHLDALARRGASTLSARAIIPTVSSPNWASILSGATPTEHGVTSNEWQRDKRELLPACTGLEEIFPTLPGLLKQQRPSARTVVFHDWEGFGRLVERGSAQEVEHHKGSPATIEAALSLASQGWPDLLILHLDDVDHAGHDHGWTSPQYVAAVTAADRLLGRLLDALPSNAIIAVVSDHGGKDKKHGGYSKEEFEIPFYLAGPAIRQNVQLQPPVSVIDAAPTLARLLGLSPHPCWRGRVLTEALVQVPK